MTASIPNLIHNSGSLRNADGMQADDIINIAPEYNEQKRGYYSEKDDTGRESKMVAAVKSLEDEIK